MKEGENKNTIFFCFFLWLFVCLFYYWKKRIKCHYRFRHKNRLLRILNISDRWQNEWRRMSPPISAHTRTHTQPRMNEEAHFISSANGFMTSATVMHTHYIYVIYNMRSSINHMEQRVKVNVIIDSMKCQLWHEAIHIIERFYIHSDRLLWAWYIFWCCYCCCCSEFNFSRAALPKHLYCYHYCIKKELQRLISEWIGDEHFWWRRDCWFIFCVCNSNFPFNDIEMCQLKWNNFIIDFKIGLMIKFFHEFITK